jgi:PAS domain S-box-containing protein
VVEEQARNKLKTLRTQHKSALDELDKYKLLVDNIQDYAIFLMDEQGYIKTWNKGAEKHKGYKAEEIIGKHFSIFYMSEDITAKKPEKELEIATQFGRVEDEDWRVRKDGSRFWASVVITALYNGDGKLLGFAKVTRDLTERKQHEDELRTANTLLRAQQQELKLLNQSKDEFISLASHQLRTPTSAIKQILGLFVEGFQPNVAEQHLTLLKKAYDSNERQIHIVNSLLKVAQVDSGKVILRLAEHNIKQLLESVIEDFSEALQSKKQTLELITDDPSISIIADAQHLRMALDNIMSNASKYTYPHGAIRVSIGRKNNLVKIAVTDNGVGIDEQDLASLFEKFKRIPNDLSDEVGGTGLGLYWANKVIALHGGRIEVESKLNQGTTFTMYLPTGT